MNINGGGVRNVVDTLINTVGGGNPELKKRAGEMMSSFSECKSPTDALGVALNQLGNPQVKEAITKGLGGIGVDLNNNSSNNPITDEEIKQLQLTGKISSESATTVNPSDQE
jgi:hypothetical protein